MSEASRFKFHPGSFPMIGGAGVHAVAAQMLTRDIVPFFPAVDRGVDMMAENGCRIQVKTARLCNTPAVVRKNLDGLYRFGFPHFNIRNASRRGVTGLGKKVPTKPFHEFCDVVVLWGVEHNRFWIVPANLLAGCGGVDLGPDNSRGFSKDVPEMRAMLTQGCKQEEVAKHFGISQAAVSIRLKRAGTKIFISRRTAAIRACENAWEHILNHGMSVPEESPASSLEEAHGMQLE